MRLGGIEAGAQRTLVPRCGPERDVLIPPDQKDVLGGNGARSPVSAEKIGCERHQ